MFKKMAEICVAISDERLFSCVFAVKISRHLEKNWEFPETYLGDFS